MTDLINQFMRIMKYSEKTINIPFNYVMFLVALFLFWQPKYIEMIDASVWVPKNIKDIILTLANSLYSNLWKIIITMIVIIICLILFGHIKYKLTEKLRGNIELSDKSIVSWNEYSAIRRILNIMEVLVTTGWIYYFLFNILFNENNYVKNFIVSRSFELDNELINSGYMTVINLQFMNLLFFLNIIITIYYVLRSLFFTKILSEKVI